MRLIWKTEIIMCQIIMCSICLAFDYKSASIGDQLNHFFNFLISSEIMTMFELVKFIRCKNDTNKMARLIAALD